jgi:hypothetical protein
MRTLPSCFVLGTTWEETVVSKAGSRSRREAAVYGPNWVPIFDALHRRGTGTKTML